MAQIKHTKPHYRRAYRRYAQGGTLVTAALVLLALCLTTFLLWPFLMQQDDAALQKYPGGEKQTHTALVAAVRGPDKTAWQLLLVNASHPLPEGYEDGVTYVRPFESSEQRVDARIEGPMQAFFEGARQAGHTLYLRSGYRSYATQAYLFAEMVAEFQAMGYDEQEARVRTLRLRNLPGTSEHETGLCADIVGYAYAGGTLLRTLADTEEFQWMNAHCAEYGFILRYPADKTDITGTNYEPWHFRYVGVEDATKIMEQGLCLEEYLKEV